MPERDRVAQVIAVEQFVHEADLFHSDPVFAGHASAALDARIDNLAACLQHAIDLLLVALVEEQDWMDVAVAGVKYIDDANIVFLADFDDSLEDLGQLGSWYDTILCTVARA